MEVRAPGLASEQRTVIAAEGEAVVIDLPAPAPAPAVAVASAAPPTPAGAPTTRLMAPPARRPTARYVGYGLIGVGAASAVVGVVFAVLTRVQADALLSATSASPGNEGAFVRFVASPTYPSTDRSSATACLLAMGDASPDGRAGADDPGLGRRRGAEPHAVDVELGVGGRGAHFDRRHVPTELGARHQQRRAPRAHPRVVGLREGGLQVRPGRPVAPRVALGERELRGHLRGRTARVQVFEHHHGGVAVPALALAHGDLDRGRRARAPGRARRDALTVRAPARAEQRQRHRQQPVFSRAARGQGLHGTLGPYIDPRGGEDPMRPARLTGRAPRA